MAERWRWTGRQGPKSARNAERFRHAFEMAPVGMAVTTTAGEYLEVNPALCALLGRSAGALLGSSWRDVSHPDDVAFSQSYVDEARESGRPYQIEKRYLRSDGRTVWALLSVSVLPASDRGEEHLLAHVVDITHRREAESALRRSNRALEQFASGASHDLREPLRAVSGFSDLLRERHADSLPPDAREYLEFIGEGVDRMNSLLEDLLSLSRAERASLEVEPVALADAVADALTDLRHAVEDRRAVIDVGELPTIPTDRGLVHRIFLNLIGNALKFVEPERPPHIAIASASESGMCRIDVTDNGIGIDPRFHDRIFETFQRLHAREEYEGSGMGLALVKTCAERLGGDVGVTQLPDGGSRFWFTLPTTGPVRREPAGTGPGEPAGNASRRDSQGRFT